MRLEITLKILNMFKYITCRDNKTNKNRFKNYKNFFFKKLQYQKKNETKELK